MKPRYKLNRVVRGVEAAGLVHRIRVDALIDAAAGWHYLGNKGSGSHFIAPFNYGFEALAPRWAIRRIDDDEMVMVVWRVS